MEQNITVVGLDVSKKMLAVAVLPPGTDRIRENKMIENHPKVIEKEVRRLATGGPVVVVYEAGPCGYTIHRQITQMG